MPKKKNTPSAADLMLSRVTPLDDQRAPAGDELAAQIGKRIIRARRGLGWSQHNLHARTKMADPAGVGVSRSVISLYELGENRPGAREIVLLCQALKVSPNWLLYGSESPIAATQPAIDFMRGDDLQLSVRLAYAMLALDRPQRDAMGSLLFTMASQKLGSDVRLSSLMMMATLMTDDLLKKIVEFVGDDAKKMPIQDLVERFVHEMAGQMLTNYGNLRRIPKDEEKAEEFDVDNPPPERHLQKTKKNK